MTESSLTRKTVRGTFWSYASFYSGKLMVFISTIILARLLTQEDFGIAGYAIVVISFPSASRSVRVTALVERRSS